MHIGAFEFWPLICFGIGDILLAVYLHHLVTKCWSFPQHERLLDDT